MGILGIASLIALPVVVVASYGFQPAGEVWQHLANTVLTDYVSNSLILMAEVAIGTLLLGVSTAWLTTMCRFPGRRIFEWALLLPMAMPAYIIAYTYTGMFDVAGPIQSSLREWLNLQYGEYWFPDIRSLWGAGAMLSLTLYPYVYLLSRAAFLEQSVCVLEVSRSLGNGPWRTFFRVALPLARPAVVAGLSLALMETLADYGTVQYFGIATFTTGIFRTWFGMDDSAAAAQLSTALLVFVFTLVLLERWSRRKMRYHHSGQRHQSLPGFVLQRHQKFGAILICSCTLFFGFLLPAGQLAYWAVKTRYMINADFLQLTLNTISLAAGTALLALLLALLMGYGRRLSPDRFTISAVRVAGMGYAVPGTVIAVGVMLPFAWIDNSVDHWMQMQFGISTGLLLSGTLVALVSAYLVRFLAVSLQTVEAGLGKIKQTIDESARTLGATPGQVLGKIHLPMLKGSLLTAILLVFVDVMKELPATLVLRPFNFNTLAVRAFELASDERLMDSASAALTIVLAGILPVILLSRSIRNSRDKNDTPT
ncbi:ABC transporter permease [Sedimenticola selenatireducens]|uniref:Iron ABC transporter permease n=1 Tax=Sedimenticola selenatireducens TaxID=191960 RepID=A0A557SI89_9GAMM|nr:iron ABC transporter permease [Sedimenticola selenatireducens]TVO77099.1 iron ABC transporter permease [Sedimenticola selenatireducens]TVT64543.1 MAG: iron ABC transporter permease [Sedimenticola selenatireducens]